MTIGFFDLAILALATWQTIEVWHHGSIMAEPRAWAQTLTGKFGQLLECMFCLSHWVAFGLLAVYVFTPGFPALRLLFVIARFVIVGLAITRLAQLGNDLSHDWNRTPKG